MFLPNPVQSLVEAVADATSDKDALYMKATIGANDAVVAGKWQSHEEVKLGDSWNIEKNLRAKTYFEV